MFVLHLTIYEMFANQIKRHTFDLENESQIRVGEKRVLHHSTGNVRFYTGDFFGEFYLPSNIRLRQKNTGTP